MSFYKYVVKYYLRNPAAVLYRASLIAMELNVGSKKPFDIILENANEDWKIQLKRRTTDQECNYY